MFRVLCDSLESILRKDEMLGGIFRGGWKVNFIFTQTIFPSDEKIRTKLI